MKSKSWMTGSSSWVGQTCDYMPNPLNGQRKYWCEDAGNPVGCCTYMAGQVGNLEYKFQIICAQPGERFTEKPESDEFENCDRMCGEDPETATTSAAAPT